MVTYTREIMASIIIIFLVCLGMGCVISIWLVLNDQATSEIIGLVMAGATGGGVAVSAGLIQTLKQVQGLICEFGTYPGCEIYTWAREHGFNEIPK